MDFLEIAKNRYSSRKYLQTPVEDIKLLKILEAARIAPSAVNKQPWTFYVIRKKNNLLKICEAYHRDWLRNAPVIIVACANHNLSWRRADSKDHADIDLAIAIDHMTLQATELGLATCWICNFDASKCSQILKLPEYIEPIAIIPLAYPADETNPNRHSTLRKTIDEIVHWEF